MTIHVPYEHDTIYVQTTGDMHVSIASNVCRGTFQRAPSKQNLEVGLWSLDWITIYNQPQPLEKVCGEYLILSGGVNIRWKMKERVVLMQLK